MSSPPTTSPTLVKSPPISVTSVGRPLSIKPLPRTKPPPIKPRDPTIGEILERAIQRLTQRKGRLTFTLHELWAEELPQIRQDLPERSKQTKQNLRALLNSIIISSLLPPGIVSRVDRGSYIYHPST